MGHPFMGCIFINRLVLTNSSECEEKPVEACNLKTKYKKIRKHAYSMYIFLLQTKKGIWSDFNIQFRVVDTLRIVLVKDHHEESKSCNNSNIIIIITNIYLSISTYFYMGDLDKEKTNEVTERSLLCCTFRISKRSWFSAVPQTYIK